MAGFSFRLLFVVVFCWMLLSAVYCRRRLLCAPGDASRLWNSLVALHIPRILTFAFLVVLFVTGLIHYLRTSFNDKIRIRQIYYTLAFLDVVAMVFLLAQPQHEDLLLRIIIITTSPLIGHFVALTYTRLTNIAFCVIFGIALLLTAFTLWSSSFIF